MRHDHSAIIVCAIEVQNHDDNAYYEASVDAHTGELVSLTNFGAGLGTVSRS